MEETHQWSYKLILLDEFLTETCWMTFFVDETWWNQTMKLYITAKTCFWHLTESLTLGTWDCSSRLGHLLKSMIWNAGRAGRNDEIYEAGGLMGCIMIYHINLDFFQPLISWDVPPSRIHPHKTCEFLGSWQNCVKSKQEFPPKVRTWNDLWHQAESAQ